MRPQIILEIGSGSGVVSVFLHQLLSVYNIYPLITFCTDLNENALKCTQQTANLNSIKSIEIIKCDLIFALSQRLANSIDILIFNPPYVPSNKPAESLEVFLDKIFWFF